MALIQLNRTKTGARPTELADGELYIDQYNGLVWWADSTGRLRNGALGGMPSGTRMLFQQSSAPVGWTKLTTHNNKALRVVSGAVSSGGTLDFDAVFNPSNGGTIGATALTIDQIPSHSHPLTDPGHTHNILNTGNNANGGGHGWLVNPQIDTDLKTLSSKTGITMGAVGGGQPHTHSFQLDMDVSYVDVILASKD
jgi:hypothetical protein